MLQSVLALKTSCSWLERAGGEQTAEAGEEGEAGVLASATISRCETMCKLFCDKTCEILLQSCSSQSTGLRKCALGRDDSAYSHTCKVKSKPSGSKTGEGQTGEQIQKVLVANPKS